MAGQQGRQDPKEAALAAARCLNPHPEQVTDPEFLGSDFFDARDAVQVKYEMVRKVKAGGAPVTEAAAAFGYSRPAYYAAAAALESSGLEGLVPARPGPRGASKLTEEILAWAEEQLAADPALRPAQLPGQIAGRLRRARAPPLGRASAGPPPGAPLQKPRNCPPARCGRRITRPCPCSHHLATRLLNQAPAWMPARPPLPAAGWTPATSSSAMPPCTRAARRSRSAWACWPARASPPGSAPWPASPQPPAPPPAPPAPGDGPPRCPPVAADLISVLAAVALAGTSPPPPLTACSC